MKRVLLTGGTGFIGANLARRLVQQGHDVHLLVRPRHQRCRIEAVRSHLTIHEAALADEGGVTRVVASLKPEWIFHLATYGAYAWETDVRTMVETNVMGTMNLVLACQRTGFDAFVNTGSSLEYGRKDHPPTEAEGLDPNSEYAVNKAWSTAFCRQAALRSKLPISTLRLYSVYGPWEDPRRLIPMLIRCGLDDTLPPLVDSDAAHDFIHIDDVIDAYCEIAVMAPVGTVYNVGTGRQMTMREVVTVARRVLSITAEPAWQTMPRRPWDTAVWQADVTSITRASAWHPRIDFEDGFRRTVHWFTSDADAITLLHASDSSKSRC